MTAMILRIIFIFFCFTLSAYSSEDNLSLFKEANKKYAASKYDQAINIYEALASQGQKNAALFYNLGNAYYKNGMPGKAMLNFERARRLAPQDQSIRNNIHFVQNVVNEPEPQFFEALMSWVIGLTAINNSALIASFFYFCFAFGIVLSLFAKPRIIILFNIFILIFMLSSIGIFFLQYNSQILTKWAVVVSACDVYSSPGSENLVSFSIPEGRKVIILAEQNSWYAIGLKNEGLKGWAAKNSIEAI